MKNNEQIRIAIAESSTIIRCGIVALLKRLPELTIVPVEIGSMDALISCFRAYAPEILIVNPTFEGGFNPTEFRSRLSPSKIKCIAMLSQLTDTTQLKQYNESITLYETVESLSQKILHLQHIVPQEDAINAETLSPREREIVVCVVKGLSNKEIAEELNLSIYTVITHRKNIARKLHIHSTAGLTIYAIVNKLIDLSEIKDK